MKVISLLCHCVNSVRSRLKSILSASGFLCLRGRTHEPILQISVQICRRQGHVYILPHVPHYTVILSAHNNLFSFPQMKAWWSGMRETYRDLLSVLGNIQKQNRSFACPLCMLKPTQSRMGNIYLALALKKMSRIRGSRGPVSAVSHVNCRRFNILLAKTK